MNIEEKDISFLFASAGKGREASEKSGLPIEIQEQVLINCTSYARSNGIAHDQRLIELLCIAILTYKDMKGIKQ